MEFGRVLEGELQDIDFTLPADSQMTAKTLAAAKGTGNLNVLIGCPKFVCPSWIGELYPAGLKQTDSLSEYAKHFNAIEFGPSFYSIYSPDDILTKFKDKVKGLPDFKFCPKFAQTITHIRKLKNAQNDTDRFLQGVSAFGDQLGPLLMQLGEGYSPKELPNLQSYLDSLPKYIKVFLEVRNKNWFAVQEYRQGLFSMLHNLNIGAVITDASGRRDCVHMELPTPHTYIRFVGNNLDPSDYARIDSWVTRIAEWKEAGLQSLTFIVHQNDEVTGPRLADYLIKQLNSKLRTDIRGPQFIDPVI